MIIQILVALVAYCSLLKARVLVHNVINIFLKIFFTNLDVINTPTNVFQKRSTLRSRSVGSEKSILF